MAVITFQILFTVLALVFLGAGAALPVLQLTPLPLAWLACLWPGVVYAVIAIAYFLPWSWNPEAVFCKSHTTGSIPIVTQVLMAPFLVPMWTLWWLRHKLVLAGLEDPNNQVHDGLHVGRFPLHFASEFPDHVQNVVDLTCEFPAPTKVTTGRQYLCAPALDCTMLQPERLLAVAHQVATWSGSTFIHCANGHGRSASLAAFVLVYKGVARNWRDAFGIIQAQRPLAHIHASQEATLDAAQALLDSAAAEEEVGDSPVRARLGPIRAASDGGMIEFKPSAPQDKPIVEYWEAKGVAVASRLDLPGSAVAALDTTIPRVDVTPMSTAVMGTEGSAPHDNVVSPLFKEGGRSPYVSGESKGGDEAGQEEGKELATAEEKDAMQ